MSGRYIKIAPEFLGVGALVPGDHQHLFRDSGRRVIFSGANPDGLHPFKVVQNRPENKGIPPFVDQTVLADGMR